MISPKEQYRYIEIPYHLNRALISGPMDFNPRNDQVGVVRLSIIYCNNIMFIDFEMEADHGSVVP